MNFDFSKFDSTVSSDYLQRYHHLLSSFIPDPVARKVIGSLLELLTTRKVRGLTDEQTLFTLQTLVKYINIFGDVWSKQDQEKRASVRAREFVDLLGGVELPKSIHFHDVGTGNGMIGNAIIQRLSEKYSVDSVVVSDIEDNYVGRHKLYVQQPNVDLLKANVIHFSQVVHHLKTHDALKKELLSLSPGTIVVVREHALPEDRSKAREFTAVENFVHFIYDAMNTPNLDVVEWFNSFYTDYLTSRQLQDIFEGFKVVKKTRVESYQKYYTVVFRRSED